MDLWKRLIKAYDRRGPNQMNEVEKNEWNNRKEKRYQCQFT